MPQTEARSDEQLAIEVDRASYIPGETVTGTITRVAAFVNSEATLDIVLHGRAKSKFMDVKDNRPKPRRGRYELLNLKQRVFEGPMHIPGNTEPQRWRFSIKVPTTIDAHTYPSKYKESDSLIPIDKESVSKMELPGSVLEGHSSGHYRREGFVEYYVEAIFQRKGFSETDTAIIPLRLLALNPHPPIVDFALIPSENKDSVTSQRLLPGMENAELSAMDSVKKFFHTSSVPKFTFNCEVSAPSLFQVGQPWVPFHIRVIPSWSDTSEAIRGKPPKASLVGFRGVLQSTTQLLCKSPAMGFYRREKWFDQFHDLEGDGYDNRPIAIDIPCGDDVAPKDVGAAMHLRLPSEIFQTFTTFNIDLCWQLDWWANCEIAGEEFTAHGNQKVKVVSASNGGPPPSFDQLQREGKIQTVVVDEKKDLE